MTQFLAAMALLAVGLLFISIRKTFRLHTPVELKRRARAHDATAAVLYPVLAYGHSLYVVLWLLIILPLAGCFWLLSEVAPGFLVFVAEALAIAYAFAWAPSTRVTNTAVRAAVLTAPLLRWVVSRSAPLVDRLAKTAQRVRRTHHHTRLYEHDDLIELIEQQKLQSDSRMAPETLDMLSHMLRFDEKRVRDCMVPRSKAKLVPAAEPIGPAFMQELHDSGYRRFPVYGDDKERLVGLLELGLIVDLKHTGTVQDVMTPHLNYLHEDHPLEQVIDAFYKTGSHLFVVINQREEFVGLVTIEDVLVEVFGYKIAGDFESYDSPSTVAAYRPGAAADDIATEVVE